MSKVDNTCDDGNLVDGDGCSSICEVEPTYKCLYGSETSHSVCVYRGNPLLFGLIRTERVEGENKGIFQFSVYPPILIIEQIDLYQYVNLSCASTYTVTQMEYTSGVLDISVDYSEDMEGR